MSDTQTESSTASAPSTAPSSLPCHLRPNSLSSLSYALSTFLLQAYLIYDRYALLSALGPQPSQLHHSLVASGCLTTLGLVFALAGLVLGTLRLGIYSHDAFFLGRTFDKSQTCQADSYRRTAMISMISSGSEAGSDASTQDSKRKLTRRIPRRIVDSCRLLKRPSFWPELPPVGVICHIVAAMLLLLAELQLDSKRIDLRQKPIGDVFSTKLDFLFGPPISRLRQLSLSSPANSSRSALDHLIRSKDDFTVFAPTPDTLRRTISLAYLNLLTALAFFALALAQTFWFTSRPFTLGLFAYLLNAAALTALSFTSLEVLSKASSLGQLSGHFLLKGQHLIVTGLFLASGGLLLASGYLHAKFGYRKFGLARVRFEQGIGKYLASQFQQQQDLPIKSQDKDEINTGFSAKTKDCLHGMARQYAEQLLSSLLLLVYTAVRVPFIYDTFVVYKLTGDPLPGLCIAWELGAILVWAVFITVMTVKSRWAFQLDPVYKLNYWNFLYTSFLGTSNAYQGSCSYAPTERKGIRRANMSSLQPESVCEPSEKAAEKAVENTTAAVEAIQQAKNSAGLLVRDDSLILNRSSNMSSSSITEVSSLMPSIAPVHRKHSTGTVLDAACLNTDFHYVYNDGQQDSIRRSYRPAGFKTSLVTSSLRSPFGSATIGEIMERRHLSRSMVGNEAALSQTTTDSGRDSLDSPTTGKGAAGKSMLSSKPFLIEAASSSVKLTGTSASRLLDTHC